MEFIETDIFSSKIYRYLDDDQFYDLQLHLMLNPNTGDVIPGSHGIRKMRWPGKGKGKRGGLRVIYFSRLAKSEIWFLDIYAKNEMENISSAKLSLLREEVPYD